MSEKIDFNTKIAHADGTTDRISSEAVREEVDDLGLVGVGNIRSSMPAGNRVPRITVTFICKFLPLAPECYEYMARALLQVGLACNEVKAFEKHAREVVKRMIDEERAQAS